MSRELLAELGALLRRCDPVPSAVLAAAEAAFTFPSREWSWLEPVAAGLVRSGARTFRFSANDISVSLELRRSLLLGLVSPVLEVELWSSAGVLGVRPDAAGFFQVSLPRGPLRVVVGQTHATRWFLP